jgi:hypothetical protein
MNIVFQAPDGTLDIVQIIDPEIQPEAHAAQLLKNGDIKPDRKAVAYAVPNYPACLPDRVHPRDLRWDGKKIVCDMDSARESWRRAIRAARVKLFEPLDVEYMKALETNDMAAMEKIVAQKKALRDAPAHPSIAKAKTVADLRKIWPL